MEFAHVSVLPEECIQGLNIRPDGVYIDGTMGGGGHSGRIASRLTDGCLIGFDRDSEAIAVCCERLAQYGERVRFVNRNFFDAKSVLEELGISQVSGVLLDLGVSSYQLDNAQRGFSYQQDAPLDMRMDTAQPFSAYDVVNTYSEDDLCDIIQSYGDERWARRIASFIVKERENAPIKTTGELVTVIKKAVPKGAREDGPHPAKRTFQAIRIEVNHELDGLKQAVRDLIDVLESGGRICIITFHSLEDRAVKEAFREAAAGCTCPKEFPVCVCGKLPQGKIITRKPIVPTDGELTQNPRARSAHLRIFEKKHQK